MTTVADVEDVLARARRLREDIRKNSGPGASWEYTFPDGLTQRYTIIGIQPVECLGDDVASLFLWAWSIKDYLKKLAQTRGRNPQLIENLVDRTPALCLLADVANKLKHAELDRRRRSPYQPRLGKPEYSSDRGGLKSLTYSAEGITVEPTSPEAIELSYPIIDDVSGRVVGDAVVILNAAITYWEKALAEL